MPDTFSHTLYLLEYRVQHYSIAIPSDLEDFLPLSESIKKAHYKKGSVWCTQVSFWGLHERHGLKCTHSGTLRNTAHHAYGECGEECLPGLRPTLRPRFHLHTDFLHMVTKSSCDTAWWLLATLTGAFTREGREKFGCKVRENSPVRTEAEIRGAAGAGARSGLPTSTPNWKRAGLILSWSLRGKQDHNGYFTVDSEPPELWNNKLCCLKWPRLQIFVMAT